MDALLREQVKRGAVAGRATRLPRAGRRRGRRGSPSIRQPSRGGVLRPHSHAARREHTGRRMDGPNPGAGPRSAQGVSSKSTGAARARASSSEPGAIWPARASRRRVWSPKNSRRAESSGCPRGWAGFETPDAIARAATARLLGPPRLSAAWGTLARWPRWSRGSRAPTSAGAFRRGFGTAPPLGGSIACPGRSALCTAPLCSLLRCQSAASATMMTDR